MNLAKAFSGGHLSAQGILQSWESEEGVHTPSGSKTLIVMCGWLHKMKREHRKFRSTWNRRWFTVEDGAFRWYKTSSSEHGGRLSLVNIKSVRKLESGEHGNFAFIVQGTDRDLFLRADSANDVSRWIRGLTLQIDLVHGGTFQGPPSAKNRRRTVLRSAGENGGVQARMPGAGGGAGVGSIKNRVYGGTSQGQMQLEHSHFRQINDRIKAIMDERKDSARRVEGLAAAGEGPISHELDALDSTFRQGRSGLDIDEVSRRGGTPTSVSIIQAFQKISRPGSREKRADASTPAGSPRESTDRATAWKRWPQAKVVPLSSLESCDNSATGGGDGVTIRSECKSSSRKDNAADAENRRPRSIGDRITNPPPPKGPPPSNNGGRCGRAAPLRTSASGWGRRDAADASGSGMDSARNQGPLADAEDSSSDAEEIFGSRQRMVDGDSTDIIGSDGDGRETSAGKRCIRRSGSRGNNRVGGTSGRDKAAQEDTPTSVKSHDGDSGDCQDSFIRSKHGGGRELSERRESSKEESSLRHRKETLRHRRRNRQDDEFEALVDASSKERSRTREDLFIDYHFASETPRSRLSSAHLVAVEGASSGKNHASRKDARSIKSTENHPEQRRTSPSAMYSRSSSYHCGNTQASRKRSSSGVGRVKGIGNGYDVGDTSSDDSRGQRARYQSKSIASSGTGSSWSSRGSSRGKDGSFDKAYSRLGAWYNGSSSDRAKPFGVPRGNSSGSVTAEESWSSGLGRGPEEDTSSRVGSGRLPSSRSGSRHSSSRPSSSSRPARRYLMEQNRFRQEW